MTRTSWAGLPRAIAVFALLAGTAAMAQAQNATIQGRVTTDQGRPIEGANVFITEMNVSVGSNAAGNYTITIPGARVRGQSVVLRARSIGQKPAQAAIVIRPGVINQNFVLEADINRLSQVVVTGVAGATEQTKVTFALARVDSADMPVSGINPLSQLQGKVAGAAIVSASGRPGAQPAVLLRGPTSINASGRGQDPLYIVDGVILNGPLPDFNSLDIESIEVVKGAAGASLYGARAGNGVIQITTKTGKGGGENVVRFGFRTEVGAGDIPNKIGLAQNHFLATDATGQLLCSADATPAAAGTYSQPCVRKFDIYAEALRINELGGDFALSPQTARYDGGIALAPSQRQLAGLVQVNPWPVTFDAIDQTVLSGAFQTSNVDVTGKYAGMNFFGSVSNTGQTGAIRGLTGLKRNTVRLNVSQQFAQKWTVGLNTYYGRVGQDGLNQDGGNGFFRLTRVPAYVNLLQRDAFGRLFIRTNPLNQGLQNDNPIYSFDQSQRDDSRDRFLGNVDVKFNPFSWLDFQGQFGYDRSNGSAFSLQDRGFRTTATNPAVNNGFIARSSFVDQSYNTSFNATARKQFGKLNAKLNTRYLYEQQDGSSLSNTGSNIPFAGLQNSGSLVQNLGIGSGVSSVRGIGMFVSTDLDYNDKYILSGLVRRDGSSLFGAGNRWATFGRVSGAYRLSQEKWWPSSVINEFKLRGSRGSAGGRPSFSAQYETFTVNTGVINPTLLGNRLLKPEVNTETEVGVDAEILSKYGLTVTFARSNIENQILPVPQPTVSGFASQWQNAGTLQNNVVEVSLNVPLVTKPNFSWSARVNFDRVRSEITKLGVPEFFTATGLQGADNSFRFAEGEKLGTFYGRRWVRECSQLPAPFNGQCGAYGSGQQFETNRDGFVVYTGGMPQDSAYVKNYFQAQLPTTSSPWAQRLNYGMLIQLRDSTTGNLTQQKLGSSIPNYRWNFSNTITFKRLNIYTLFDATVGQQVYNQGEHWSLGDFATRQQDQSNQSVTTVRPIGYWWRGGPPISGAGIGGFYDLLSNSEYSTQDATYGRMRELSLSYRVGKVGGVGNWTVGMVGRNLFTVTNYRGFDPETGVDGGQLGSAVLNGIDRYGFPNLRTFTFSLGSSF
jgi:TonB-linked SusC/RagA family outer membrane protein